MTLIEQWIIDAEKIDLSSLALSDQETLRKVIKFAWDYRSTQENPCVEPAEELNEHIEKPEETHERLCDEDYFNRF